jgi:DNA repair exonuclease SbcCD ATPase subunit
VNNTRALINQTSKALGGAIPLIEPQEMIWAYLSSITVRKQDAEIRSLRESEEKRRRLEEQLESHKTALETKERELAEKQREWAVTASTLSQQLAEQDGRMRMSELTVELDRKANEEKLIQLQKNARRLVHHRAEHSISSTSTGDISGAVDMPGCNRNSGKSPRSSTLVGAEHSRLPTGHADEQTGGAAV